MKENSINNVDFILTNRVKILVIKSICKLDYLYLFHYYQNKLEDDPLRENTLYLTSQSKFSF